jgi:hypothetical protein
MVLLGETQGFPQLSQVGLFGKHEPFCNLKILIGKMYSFQKLTQYSQGNNVLDLKLLK